MGAGIIYRTRVFSRSHMGAAIEADGLTKRFGDFTAVDHVSFTVEEGEIFGFLGPNGAGKTTTINMLITLMRPTEGTARVAGYDVVAEPDRVRERISVVFQDPTLDRRLTGWENLWIHGRLYGIPRDELAERIERAARFTEIERWLHVTVDRYSGGMMRRLEIARALLYEADVIFLDEPTVGLDPQTRARIWEYIRALRREGLTIFLTTHYMDEAERLCDRVAIIDHGRIVAMGTVDELKSIVGGEVVYVAVDPPGEAGRLAEAIQREGLGSEVRALNGTVSISTENAAQAIPAVVSLASSLGVGVREVRYRTPDLEDVFLHVTGRSLRDEEASFFDHVRMRRMARMRRAGR